MEQQTHKLSTVKKKKKGSNRCAGTKIKEKRTVLDQPGRTPKGEAIPNLGVIGTEKKKK